MSCINKVCMEALPESIHICPYCGASQITEDIDRSEVLSLLSLLKLVAKIDGNVHEYEEQFIKTLETSFKINNDERKLIINKSRLDDDVEILLDRILGDFRSDLMKKTVVETLFHLSFSDGYLTPEEQRFIRLVCNKFGFDVHLTKELEETYFENTFLTAMKKRHLSDIDNKIEYDKNFEALIKADDKLLTAIFETCKSYELDDFHVGKDIPKKKLDNAIVSFPIPVDVIVIALLDTTLFGSNDYGLAITSNGIYWKNDSSAKHSNRVSLTWHDLYTIPIEESEVKKGHISLGFGNFLAVSSDAFAIEVIDMLLEIQKIIRDEEYFDPTNIEKSKRDEIEAVCYEFYGDDYYVLDSIPQKKLPNILEWINPIASGDVIAFVETEPPFFGSGGNVGIAVMEDRICWKNSVKEPPVSLDSEDLKEISIKRKQRRIKFDEKKELLFNKTAFEKTAITELIKKLSRIL